MALAILILQSINWMVPPSRVIVNKEADKVIIEKDNFQRIIYRIGQFSSKQGENNNYNAAQFLQQPSEGQFKFGDNSYNYQYDGKDVQLHLGEYELLESYCNHIY